MGDPHVFRRALTSAVFVAVVVLAACKTEPPAVPAPPSSGVMDLKGSRRRWPPIWPSS